MGAIHKTAIVDKSAEIDESVNIGPYSVIEQGVTIGSNCFIDSCVKIGRGVKMGASNEVHHGTYIGGPPQDLGFDYNTESGVLIGDNNIFREQSTIHRSKDEGQNTVLGNNNFIMATGHIAHDCRLGNNNIICNGALVAGHIHMGHNSFISGNVVIHQFCHIGDYVMIGGGARVSQDCPHFAMIVGAEMAQIVNINIVGLRRGGFSPQDRKAIKRAYKIMVWSRLGKQEIIDSLKKESNGFADQLAEFLEQSERGICSGKQEKL